MRNHTLPDSLSGSDTGALKPGITVRTSPLTANIGAVIEGCDLAQCSHEDVEAVQRAVIDHHVAFLPRQGTDPAALVSFARCLAALATDHPAYLTVHPDHPEIAIVSNDDGGIGAAAAWHADVTWAEQPPLGSVLQLVTVPEFGGDTLWIDLAAALDDLSDRLRGFLDTLTAVHRVGERKAEHPVVRHLPESSRTTLFVNPTFTSHIVDLSAAESAALLDFLYRHCRRPEYEVRWRWSAGDVAVWDNRCTWHYALGDHGRAPRRAHRLSLIGDRFGPVA